MIYRIIDLQNLIYKREIDLIKYYIILHVHHLHVHTY